MGTEKISTKKPLLIMLYGFPGSGKTYFARQLSETLNSAHLYSDKIRHELFDNPRFDEEENGIVNHLVEYMTEEFLKSGVSVIFDASMIRKNRRREIRELARKRGANTLIVWFQIDADAAIARLQKRDKRTSDDKYSFDYSKEDFKEYASQMQHPEPTEDYVVVSGKHVFKSQKATFFKKLMELGYIDGSTGAQQVVKPGLINLVPNSQRGRVNDSRRNINIH